MSPTAIQEELQSNGCARTVQKARTYEKTKKALTLERKYAAGNYHPLGVVFDHALGAKVWDIDGNEYIDVRLHHSLFGLARPRKYWY